MSGEILVVLNGGPYDGNLRRVPSDCAAIAIPTLTALLPSYDPELGGFVYDSPGGDWRPPDPPGFVNAVYWRTDEVRDEKVVYQYHPDYRPDMA